MKSNTEESQSLNYSSNNFTDCHRQTCILRIIGDCGNEVCLMESVRAEWSMPSAKNYCKDPISRKFVDHLHLKI